MRNLRIPRIRITNVSNIYSVFDLQSQCGISHRPSSALTPGTHSPSLKSLKRFQDEDDPTEVLDDFSGDFMDEPFQE